MFTNANKIGKIYIYGGGDESLPFCVEKMWKTSKSEENMKKILYFIASIFSLILLSTMCFAGTFEKSGEYYRYFDDQGAVVYDQFVEVERQRYYITSDGYAAFNSWINKDSKIYYAGNNGVLYNDGIKEIEGYKYYFNSECELQKGWIDDYMYYGDLEDGILISGFQELDIPKDWYTEENKETSGWFYFDTSTCKKYYAKDSAYVSKIVGNRHYCFDQNGIMRTGWRQIKETVPLMKGYMYFVEDASDEFKFGEAVTNTWYSVEPPAEVLPNAEVRYFYFNGQGVPRCAPQGKFSKVRINDKTYLFNEYGYVVYGIRKIDEEYYYFGDSVEDCSMRIGIIKRDIDGSGDAAMYYFQDDGTGFTGVYNNKLYYKGKLQVASPEQKYAGIRVGNLVRLVNSSGTIMKNKKKVKDGDGCAWSTNSGGVVTYMDDEAEEMQSIPPEENTDN